ncbi:hypothetical protein [Pseudodonghicola flavimaris]|uniref:DUF1127 domain-containing protein n=1 Tax=Pseudodonghicola flavimaris TaxID=3050036 RepID=A0ABT7F184_9RHOB|nr:hypothetical protein [Pseudodonghicola flavimaris]MDK3018370.1 hypothetical protein [Pseudodonghicola flavimaris]
MTQMQTATLTARHDTAETEKQSPARPGLLLRLLNWIADADNRYRQKQQLKSLPAERLDDMGMSRRDADRAFSRYVPKRG